MARPAVFPVFSLSYLRVYLRRTRVGARVPDGPALIRRRRRRAFVPPPAAGFEYFEHTADVGIRAWGASLDEAFAQAARGLISQMVDTSAAKPVGEARVEVEAESVERLLFAFLDEMLDLFYTRLWVLAQIDVRIEGETKLVATLRGEAYEAARHGHVHEVKAMTYHGLEVRRDPPEVRVIVDI